MRHIRKSLDVGLRILKNNMRSDQVWGKSNGSDVYFDLWNGTDVAVQFLGGYPPHKQVALYEEGNHR